VEDAAVEEQRRRPAGLMVAREELREVRGEACVRRVGQAELLQAGAPAARPGSA